MTLIFYLRFVLFFLKVSWLACWVENIQGSYKYVMLNPTSRLKVRINCSVVLLSHYLQLLYFPQTREIVVDHKGGGGS